MIDTKVNIAGVELKNPVTVASGTFGFGLEYNEFYDISKLGAVSVKGLTLKEREGNKPPRIAEVKGGILNSVGLQNPGVMYFVEHYLKKLKDMKVTVIANIAGNTEDEYCEMARILSDTDVDLIEMNVSCPNVKEGGIAFGVNPKTLCNITEKVRKSCKKPLIVKLSPNVSDICENARGAVCGGADALSLINTLLGMKIDIKTKRPMLNNNMGGLSGGCVMPVAVRMVYQVANCTDVPIIGMGGIETTEDALEFMIAGASAVSIGTANFKNPMAGIEIVNGIEKYMEENKIKNINDIVGSVKIN